MSDHARLFNDRSHLLFAAALASARRAARAVPLFRLKLIVFPLLLSGLVVLDFELFFRIFDYAVGGSEGYWNSSLMAATGLVMLIAFHIKAARAKKSRLIRFIEKASSWAILAFAVGGGSYVAVLLFRDGLAAVGIDVPWGLPGEEPPIDPSEWVEAIFTYLLEPGSVLSVSLGIGGLTILLLFVGHVLLSGIINALEQIRTRRDTLTAIQAEYTAIREAEGTFGDIIARISELDERDQSFYETEIADEVLEITAQRLLVHEQALQEMLFGPPQGLEQEPGTDEAGRVAEAIDAIRSITFEEIIQAMAPMTKTRKRK